ncbi:alpha/beta fold hydrolase [Moraxella sp. FZFQ2102]|uniref:alpha/beta fold hydrolase n=1 Tax=Moraxella sp. FZFQ2102 TaxID=2953752 RepID=UPI00209C116E|nr:alpha/beta hydrolase [Moraxella sp. FZFQ2102]USZ14892.1 alpha/beta fold hydrolase [Moraxella sp. FZFQ2102]
MIRETPFHTQPSTVPDGWQKFGDIHWYPSDLSEHLYQAIIDIGDGIQLCVEAGGNPEHPPMIFVTGLGSQMLFWSDSFLKLFIDAGFFVIRFDNRDTGLSSKIQIDGLPRLNKLKMMLKVQAGLSNKGEQVPYTLTDMAEDVARLIKTMHLSEVNLIGASMGGMIAQIVAARYPKYIKNLTLLFSTANRAFLRPPNPKQFMTFVRRPESHSERDMVRHSVWFMTAVGSPGHLDIKGTRAIAEKRYQRNFHPLGVAQQLTAILASGSILKFTKQIRANTLVIHGDKDGLVAPSHGKFLAKVIPNARFVLVSGMGHDLPAYYHPYLATLISNHCKS